MRLIVFEFELDNFRYRIRPAYSVTGVTIAFQVIADDGSRGRWNHYLDLGTKNKTVYASIEEAVAHVRDVKKLRAEVKGGSNE